MSRKTSVKVISHERGSSHNRYFVDLGDGRSAEVLYSRRPGGRVEILGGEVSGCEPAEHVAAFREAADWLSRFVDQYGAPHPGLVGPSVVPLPAADGEEQTATTA